MATNIKLRRDTASNWTSNNPTMLLGEVGLEIDTKKMKVGDGVTAWNSLTYWFADGGEANTASNQGAGNGIFKQKTGVDLELKSLVAGTNITLNDTGDEIEIVAAGGASGEANTASNVGTGEGVFKQKTGVDLEFKNILAGSNVTVNTVGDDIVIASTGGSSVSEYMFNLPAGADMATRIAGVTNLPSGWALDTADSAAIQEFGSNATTLVIEHNQSKIAIEIAVYEDNQTGFATNKGIAKIDLTSPGEQKSSADKNYCGVIDLQSSTDASLPLIVFVKLM